jgi:hypothetical protein
MEKIQAKSQQLSDNFTKLQQGKTNQSNFGLGLVVLTCQRRSPGGNLVTADIGKPKNGEPQRKKGLSTSFPIQKRSWN